MLTGENVSIAIENKILVKKLNFIIKPQNMVIIKGKNGVGKTTLLRTLATVIPHFKGKINWNKQSINNNINYLEQIIYIAHHLSFKEDLSVLDNLLFYAKLTNSLNNLEAAINYFKLEKVLNLKIKELSIGWQKRVSLARLIYQPAMIWLLDEPEVNLDFEIYSSLINLIKNHLKLKGIIIIASHQNWDDANYLLSL